MWLAKKKEDKKKRLNDMRLTLWHRLTIFIVGYIFLLIIGFFVPIPNSH